MHFLDPHEYAVVEAAADRLIPPLDAHPGGAALGVADYVDNLLGAFTFDPPRIFAGGPFSGRAGGEEQDRRIRAQGELRTLFYTHACEGAYGPPEYGGNTDLAAWTAIQFPGD